MELENGQFDKVKKKRVPLFDRFINGVDSVVTGIGNAAVKGVVKLGHALGDHDTSIGGTFDPECRGCQSDLHEALLKRGPGSGIVGYIEGGKK